MSTTQHTGHYNLPTFGDNPNDRPSWRGDFTDAMTKIDNQMYTNATNITTATAAANNAKTAADEAKETADTATGLAQANKTDIAELDGYFGKLGVTSAQTAQNLMDTINGKAEDTDLTALKGTVSALSSKVDGKADSSSVYTRSQADTTFTKQGGYSGTAQQLNQLIGANTSDISALKAWTQAFESEWSNLGEFTYNATPSTTLKDNRCNIQCYYNEKIKAIKVFGFFAFGPTRGSASNFSSISVASRSPLPESLRPASDIHMDAALVSFFNGEKDGIGSYTDLNMGDCCVTVKTNGIVMIGENSVSGYSDNIVNHNRQSARAVLPQCIYLLQQSNN